LLPAYVGYCYNEITSKCWGSKEKVREWLGGEDIEIKLGTPIGREVKQKSMAGAEMVAEERRRHVEEVGYGAAHDRGHTRGELAINAASLALAHTDAKVDNPHDHDDDPWGLVGKHRGNPVRSLTIAGSLICAEIDRIIARQQGLTRRPIGCQVTERSRRYTRPE
jgi:hypothetical protein